MTTSINEASAALDAMTAQHEAAKRNAAAARAALASATGARAALIDAAASTGKGNIEDVSAADEAIRTAAHNLELRTAFASAAKKFRDVAEVTLWNLQAADLKAKLREAVRAHSTAAKAADEAINAARAAIDAYHDAGQRVATAASAAAEHDASIGRSSYANTALGPYEHTWPRTRVKAEPPPPPVRLKVFLAAMHREFELESVERTAAGAYGELIRNMAA